MAGCSSLTDVSSVEELPNRGNTVYQYFLHFRFNTAHQKRELYSEIRTQLESRGWNKEPDFEGVYVWSRSGPSDEPPDVVDILEQYSYENHICRYLIGPITSSGKLQETGATPVASDQKLRQRVSPPNRRIPDYFPRASNGGHIVQMLRNPEVAEVKPLSLDESD